MSRLGFSWAIVVLVAVLAPTGGAFGAPKFCSQTAQLLYEACGFELEDDFLVAKAICTHLSGDIERVDCFREARASRAESRQFCREQRTSGSSWKSIPIRGGSPSS
jgi:hypothetical protein